MQSCGALASCSLPQIIGINKAHVSIIKLVISGMATDQTSAELPELYHKSSATQRYNNSELLKLISIPPNATVLDLACGTGLLTVSLSELVGPNGQVVAVDPDAQRIEFAKKESARPNIEYLVGGFPGEKTTISLF